MIRAMCPDPIAESGAKAEPTRTTPSFEPQTEPLEPSQEPQMGHTEARVYHRAEPKDEHRVRSHQ